MTKPCKTQNPGCPYHACMTDHCQQKVVKDQSVDFGPGVCEKTKFQNMKDIKTTMYIVVNKRGSGELSTLKSTRAQSIKDFLIGSEYTWNQARKFGWRCEKVDVLISTVSYNWR